MSESQQQSLQFLVDAGEATRAIDAMQERLVQASAIVDFETMSKCAVVFEALRTSRLALRASFDIAETIRAQKPADEKKEGNE